MNRKIFLSVLTFAIAITSQAQNNCFDQYSGTYKLQGGFPIPDGMHKVVVAIKDSMNKALCIEGKMMVRNDTIILPVYILRENGSYSETYGKFDNSFYRHILGDINYSISDAMSPVFMLTYKRKARVFFPEYLKPNGGAMVSAPGPNSSGVKPKKEDLDKIKMSAKSIQFETGKSVIAKSSYPTLDIIAELVQNYPDTKWSIDGFTDNTGNATSNFTLSEKRAAAVEDYLISKGVKAETLFAAGHGSDNPIADNSMAEGRQQNRRVEIKPF